MIHDPRGFLINWQRAKYTVAIAKYAGIKTAILFQYILQCADEDGLAPLSVKDTEDDTALSVSEQTSALKILVRLGFIHKPYVMGLPAKRYVNIHENCLQKVGFMIED
jgi:hypothetical protein